MPVLNIRLATHPPETMNVLFSIFIALLYPGSVSLHVIGRFGADFGLGPRQRCVTVIRYLQNLKLCSFITLGHC